MSSLQTIAAIQVAVALHYGIPLKMMLSDQRLRRWAHPRQVAMFLSRELTPKSLTIIAERFHRDHSTVIHGVRAVAHRAKIDAEVADDLEILRERLGGER